MGLLSRPKILEYLESGDIIIDPFDERNLGTNSYDITLGEHVWREHEPTGVGWLYNVYDEEHVNRCWEGDIGRPWNSYPYRLPLNNIGKEDKVILIKPGEALLGHTIEFIGGATSRITSMMNARSSTGRNFLEVSRCAGVGDVGYCNRWTMEITNNSRWHTIPLVVGRRIGQILFYEVDPVEDWTYKDGRKYQLGGLDEMKQTWSPEDMLPKMYLDREVNDGD